MEGLFVSESEGFADGDSDGAAEGFPVRDLGPTVGAGDGGVLGVSDGTPVAAFVGFDD